MWYIICTWRWCITSKPRSIKVSLWAKNCYFLFNKYSFEESNKLPGRSTSNNKIGHKTGQWCRKSFIQANKKITKILLDTFQQETWRNFCGFNSICGLSCKMLISSDQPLKNQCMNILHYFTIWLYVYIIFLRKLWNRILPFTASPTRVHRSHNSIDLTGTQTWIR
jgi:hypothetical protein